MKLKREIYSEFGGDLQLSKQNRTFLYILVAILLGTVALFTVLILVYGTGEEPIIDWRFAYGLGFFWLFLGIFIVVIVFSRRVVKE